jgi:hypothetical protein
MVYKNRGLGEEGFFEVAKRKGWEKVEAEVEDKEDWMEPCQLVELRLRDGIE